MRFEFELYRAMSKSKEAPRALKLILNSNDRMHFHQKGNIVAKLRELANSKVWEYSKVHQRPSYFFTESVPCGVTLTVFTPTKRRSDPDNLQPTLKAIMDGFTEAGLWPDDNHEVVRFTKYQYGGLSGTKAYRLQVDIQEIMEEKE